MVLPEPHIETAILFLVVHTALFRQVYALLSDSMLKSYILNALMCHAGLQTSVKFPTAWNLPFVPSCTTWQWRLNT